MRINLPARLNLWISLGLVAVTLIIYWPVRNDDFTGLDDDEYVLENIHVRNGFTPANVAWAFTSVRYAVNWHPLTWLSHMLDCQLFGLRPGGPHLVNAILHALSSAILFLALNRMTKAPWRSAFVAALFALHPLHVESVAWISERKDVLSGLFWMLTIAAYAGYAKNRNWWRYGLVIFVFSLGLMAKPMLVTLPCVLLLLDWWPLGRFGREPFVRLVLEKVPMLLLSCVASVFVVRAQGPLAMIPLSKLWLSTRLQHSVAALMIYLEKAVWPTNLAIYYPYGSVWPQWTVLPSAIGLGLLLMLFVWQARKRPWLLIGSLWFVGAMIPVIGLVQVGAQGRADRYTYIPLIGFFIAVTWQLAEFGRRNKATRITLGSVGVLIIAACAWVSARQISYWKDDLTLFSDTAASAINNAYAQDLGATALAKRGFLSEAIQHWDFAIEMDSGLASAHANLAEALAKRGRFVEAIEHSKAALKLAPNDFETQSNLAKIYATCPGHLDPPAAVQLAQEGCVATGYDWPIYLDILGMAYASAGRFKEAIASAEKAERIARAAGETKLPAEIEGRIALYKQGIPFVETEAGSD